MGTRTRTITSALAGFALAASAALAQHAARGPVAPPGADHGRCGARLTSALGLSESQQADLEALRQETAEAIQPILEQMHALHEKIDTAASASSPDACAIGTLVIQGQALRAQVESVRQAAEAKFVSSLSTAQKATYDNFVSVNPGCAAVGGGFPPPPRG